MTTQFLTDEDREIIRKLSDDVNRQQEAFAAQMERSKQAFTVQYSAADGAPAFAETVYAANAEEAQRVGENLAYVQHIKTRFVKVWS